MEHLSRYDRATVGLWARSHGELGGPAGGRCLSEAAVHAVLAGLRRCREPATLFARYEVNFAADLALIGSLLPGDATRDLLWRVRDAAFHLRWQELTDGGDGG